jgi:hypothetical protein
MAAPSSYSVNRYMRGNLEVADYPVASGVQVNVGDLIILMSGNVVPVSNMPLLSGSETQSWSGARSQFLGVSMGQNNSYSVFSGHVPVALTGIFSYPFPAVSGSSYNPGTFVSFTQDQSSGYYQPQEIMQCSGQASAIGKVEEFQTAVASGTGNLVVTLQSVVVFGGIAN